MEVTRIFSFDSAHFLTNYHGKCENIHGHTYKLEITVEGPVSENGLLLDFTILKNIVEKRIIDKLDHKSLNDIIDNPSAENISIWAWNELTKSGDLLAGEIDKNLPKSRKKVKLKKIRLWESSNSYVTYYGK